MVDTRDLFEADVRTMHYGYQSKEQGSSIFRNPRVKVLGGLCSFATGSAPYSHPHPRPSTLALPESRTRSDPSGS